MAAPPDPSVRPGTADDAGELARLRWEWRAGQGRPLEMDEARFTEAFVPWVVAHLATHVPFVAADDDGLVGMGWIALFDRVPGPDQWTRRSATVQAVYVTPARRGAGIGAAVTQALLDHAAALGCDYVTVHPSQRSFPMYRRLGFATWEGVLELDLHATRMPPT